LNTGVAIHHVQVAVPAGGEAAARSFYGVLLGLAEVAKPPGLVGGGGVWFDTGSVPLHLGVDPDFRPSRKGHVAFQVTDLERIRERVRAAGHPVNDDEALPGYRRFYTDDPFGNRVELLEPE